MAQNTWKLDNGDKIDLLTIPELNALPDGTVVTCISGDKFTKGKDYLDDDTHFGYTAFGLPTKEEEE